LLEDGGTCAIGRPVYSSCFPRLDLGRLGVGLSMSTPRRGSVLLCSSVPGVRRLGCGEVPGVRRLGCGEVGVPSSLIDGGFPASTADDCTRSVNKTAFFPAGGVDGGVKLLVLLLLSIGLVLGTVVDSSLSSFAESGVVRFVLLLFCERAGDLVIPDVGLLFRSPAFGPVAAELLSPSFPAVPTADVRSVLSIRLGEWPRWLLRHFQSLGVALQEGRWNLPASGVRLRRAGARSIASTLWTRAFL